MPAVRRISRDAIVDAAVEVLREGGFSAVNARSVAKKAGLLNAADLLRRFRTWTS